jgi:enterochelin esterase-like enzyme
MSIKICTLLLLMAALNLAYSQPIISPDVQIDGRVTFHLTAPNAKEVQLQCEGVTEHKMQKDDRGVWSLTTEPLSPDIYAYSFQVDGLRTIDPSNPLLKYNLLNTDSQVHVPGPATLPWEINDVPRGQLHCHFYKSVVGGDERGFYVYTPPGYNPAARQRYPVLYLLHGYSDEASAWTAVGRANIILDNLIARKQAKPMLIVMPLGYGTMEIIQAGWQRVRSPELWQRNVDKFRESLLQEVLPQVERSYRVAADRNSRAIAGLSMGGAESLVVGLNALDRFAWIGAFSTGGLNTNYPVLFPALNEKASRQLRLLWLGCGEQDGLLAGNQKLSEWLTSQGIRHTWVQTPGQHSFRVWRRYLAEFTPLLFQDKKRN